MNVSLKRPVALALLFAAYFLSGKLALSLAFVNPSASAVWPPAGIALAAFILGGYRLWPAIFLAAFLVNVTTTGSIATSLAIATGNTLEGVLGAYLVNRFAGGRDVCRTPQRIFRFTALTAIGSTPVSALLGVTSLCIGGSAHWLDYEAIATTWWLGDLTGALLVAPLMLLWATTPRLRWKPIEALEALAMLGLFFTVVLVVFGGLFPSDIKNYPLEFLCVPFLLWAAFRFGRREAATVIATLAAVAAWGTLRGDGPFVRDTENESLLLLQAYLGVTSVMSLALAAVVAEYKQAEDRLLELSSTDPLTGLANYRRLLEILRGEIVRSERTKRPFAVLLIDLDGLKRINDRYGHLAGSRALCRVADTLRRSCRATDTPARFGGDEFAVVLPETGGVGGRQVAERVSLRLLLEDDTPTISVSAGLAEFPRDGATATALLGAADRDLYLHKTSLKGDPGPKPVAVEQPPVRSTLAGQ